MDLISYDVESVDPLQVEEAVPATGGKCGGTFVNRIFAKRIMDRIGPNSGISDVGIDGVCVDLALERHAINNL